jgi:hypothetical protein
MTDEVLNSLERRRLLAGLGTVAIGGAAASFVGRTALADVQGTKMDATVPAVCVFDVNETLLDTNSLRRCFNDCLAIGKSCASGLGGSLSIRMQ